MDEPKNPGPRLWDCVVEEIAERLPACIAGRYGGRHGGDPDKFVSRQTNAEVRDQMRMQIDEPWSDEPAVYVDPLQGTIRRYDRRQRRDLTILDANVPSAMKIL